MASGQMPSPRGLNRSHALNEALCSRRNSLSVPLTRAKHSQGDEKSAARSANRSIRRFRLISPQTVEHAEVICDVARAADAYDVSQNRSC